MNRTPVNPWPWSLQFGYNQAEIVEGAARQVTCAGPTSVDFDVVGSRFGAAGATPPITLLGVTRLAMPPLLFEIEATAAD